MTIFAILCCRYFDVENCYISIRRPGSSNTVSGARPAFKWGFNNLDHVVDYSDFRRFFIQLLKREVTENKYEYG